MRSKLSCRQCERIVQAPAPSRPIARGLAGPGLLAHVLVSKYADHLERETRTYMPKEVVCPDCQGELRKLSEDVSEVLEYVPEQIKVIRYVRPKLSCRQCERIVQAPAPSRPIARGLAGPGLLAHVLVSNYADHLPLYRQCEIYERQGVELERSTWRTGSVAPVRCWIRWWRRYGVM